ncbi:DUF342 domain-containing protein [Acetomicrobium mobile]|uniref:DUF342 domain-containing protein n=1 Tax=Acetomicrobium mobile TaxID=97477 RepID=UPI0026EACEF3|nr:FapA family protein [Acetomicrobium mobile]
MNSRPFSVYAREDGVYIEVKPGKDVSKVEIIGYLKRQGIEVEGNLIDEIIDQRRGEIVKISDEVPSGTGEATIEVDISEDGIEALIHIIPPLDETNWPSPKDLEDELKKAGVTFGIKRDLLEKACAEKIGHQWMIVAEGIKPIDGEDAHVDLKVDLERLKPKVDDPSAARVDLRELGAVINVFKGQVLAEKIPPKQGRDGINVLGKPIKAKQARDKNLPKGNNTEISEDGLKLIAAIDGNLVVRDGKLHVMPVYEVDGDVDYSVGNVNFIGSVLIKGSVRDGFTVIAGSDIQVGGVVEAANLRASGRILIRGGIRGMGRAHIEAESDIIALFIDQSYVKSNNNVIVERSIMHSTVMATEKITVMGGRRGVIVGGSCSAGFEISCVTLGSEMGTKTEVQVGIIPSLQQELKIILQNLEDLEEKLNSIENNLAYIKRLEAQGMIDQSKRALMLQLSKAKLRLQSSVEFYDAQRQKLEGEILRVNEACRVKVKGACYPGVIINMRGITYIVRDRMEYVTFYFDKGEIKFTSYS